MPATVPASGNAWQGGGSDVMTVERTHYSTTTVTYGSKSALSTTPAALTVVPETSSVDTFWQLQAVLPNTAYDGPATQTVTLTVAC